MVTIRLFALITSVSAANLMTMDYVYKLLEGLRAEDYIEGSYACGNLARFTEYDLWYMMQYFNPEKTARPSNLKERRE